MHGVTTKKNYIITFTISFVSVNMVLWQRVSKINYTLAIYLISISYFRDTLPQHHIYRNELNCECYNITLTRRNIAP